MRFLVISDTHRNIENAVALINRYIPDYVLHLGDICDDCDRLSAIFPKTIILSVIGNNDYSAAYPDYPNERIFTLCGKKFFMCHGHRYRVKFGLTSLIMKAREVNADIVLFGHTHSPFLDISDEMIVMNPGSVRSYGIIDITDGKIDARTERYEF